jgi:hypothetical protein
MSIKAFRLNREGFFFMLILGIYCQIQSLLNSVMLKTNAFADDEGINVSLLRITCIFWLIAKLIGWRMFTTCRTFPTAPLFEYFDHMPAAVHVVLFSLSVLLTALLLVFSKNKSLLTGLLIIEIFLCLLDQNRWQPWEYQYTFILVVFIVNTNRQKLVTTAFTFILVSTYFYSGLGKLNEGFLDTIWTKMFLELFFKVPAPVALQHWVHYSGCIVGLTEVTAGIGLLFSKTRKISAWALILMHLFILVFLGSFGLRYNKIVWPWNAAMILFLCIIFLKKTPVIIDFKSIFGGWNKLVFICWGILPALNFVGCWDNYLSSGIYSGKLPRMVICIKDTGKCKPLLPFCKSDYHNLCNGEAFIDLQYWALSETHVTSYPEIRVYKKIQKKLEQQYPDAGLRFFYFVDGSVKKPFIP